MLRQERKMDEAVAFIDFRNKIVVKAKRAIVFLTQAVYQKSSDNRL